MEPFTGVLASMIIGCEEFFIWTSVLFGVDFRDYWWCVERVSVRLGELQGFSTGEALVPKPLRFSPLLVESLVSWFIIQQYSLSLLEMVRCC